jgi:hypothetical protein
MTQSILSHDFKSCTRQYKRHTSIDRFFVKTITSLNDLGFQAFRSCLLIFVTPHKVFAGLQSFCHDQFSCGNSVLIEGVAKSNLTHFGRDNAVFPPVVFPKGAA